MVRAMIGEADKSVCTSTREKRSMNNRSHWHDVALPADLTGSCSESIDIDHSNRRIKTGRS